MGQILFSEIVKPLINSSPIITLPSGSILNIGGQQYLVSSAVNLTLSGLTTLNLYMVYAVVTGGAVTLVTSTNNNSVGPGGATSWRLVGAFYASTATTVGSFVNIRGVPTTNNTLYTPIFNGLGSPTAVVMNWRRLGDCLEIKGSLTQGTTTAVEARIGFPGSLLSSASLPTLSHSGTIATGGLSTSTVTPLMLVEPSVNYFTLGFYQGTTNSLLKQNGNAGFLTGPTGISSYAIPITGWFNTALEDL